MFWMLVIVGAAVAASVHPQSRDRVKNVPWMPLAVAVGLGALGDGLHNFGKGSAQKLSIHSEKPLRVITYAS